MTYVIYILHYTPILTYINNYFKNTPIKNFSQLASI